MTFALSISPKMKLVRSPFGVLLVREHHPPDSFDGLSGLCLAFPARYTIPAPPAGHRSKAAQPVFISDEHVGSAKNRASTVGHPLCRPPQRRTVAVGRLASARRISATSPPREGDWKRRPVLRQGRRLRRKDRRGVSSRRPDGGQQIAREQHPQPASPQGTATFSNALSLSRANASARRW